MRKITFFLIALLPQKIMDSILLKIERFISDFFSLPIPPLLRESDSTSDSSKENCRVIKLKTFQKIGKIQDSVVRKEYDSMDYIPPEIRSLIIYNIMDAFSKKLPLPYHQRRIIRGSKAHNNGNEKYQILRNLN